MLPADSDDAVRSGCVSERDVCTLAGSRRILVRVQSSPEMRGPVVGFRLRRGATGGTEPRPLRRSRASATAPGPGVLADTLLYHVEIVRKPNSSASR